MAATNQYAIHEYVHTNHLLYKKGINTKSFHKLKGQVH